MTRVAIAALSLLLHPLFLSLAAGAAPETVCPASLVWDSPSLDAKGSMPIGNGDIGLNAWVEANGDLVFYISKTDAWSENGRLLKLGRVRVKFNPPLVAEGRRFCQHLMLHEGMIQIDQGPADDRLRVRVWVDANRPVVHVDAEAARPITMSAALETWRTTKRQLQGDEVHSAYGLHGDDAAPVFVYPDTIVPDPPDRIVWYHRNNHSIWSDNLTLQSLGELTGRLNDPLLCRTFGATMQGDGLVGSSDRELTSRQPQRCFALAIYPLTSITTTPQDWIDLVDRQINTVSQSGPEEQLAQHRQWWADFWNRSWIRIEGDQQAEQVSRAYALQRWINACGGRGASPIKFNGTIFTVDTYRRDESGKLIGGYDADYRRWGGPYWWQNTRLPYWSMLSSGDFDLMEPLFRMCLDALPLRQHATRTYYGHKGAFYPETMYFWGTYTDANYGRTRQGKPVGLTDNGYIRRYWQGGIELVAMMLDYHDLTQDAEFRDKMLVPLATEITIFFHEHWPRNDKGQIHYHPAQSLETWWDATNPLPEIAGLRFVLPRLLNLPVDDQRKATWRKMLTDLPPVPTREKNGKAYLAPAQRFANKRNQENPELYALFPYRLYTVVQSKEKHQIGLRTFAERTHKGTGGWNQNAVQAAALGLAEKAKGLVAENARRTAPGYRFPAIWGPNYDWIPDQDHGSVMMIALQRMLLQTDDDSMHLFPAWPRDWNVSFRLHAPGKTMVEGRLVEGQLEELHVEPEARAADIVLPNWLQLTR